MVPTRVNAGLVDDLHEHDLVTRQPDVDGVLLEKVTDLTGEGEHGRSRASGQAVLVDLVGVAPTALGTRTPYSLRTGEPNLVAIVTASP